MKVGSMWPLAFCAGAVAGFIASEAWRSTRELAAEARLKLVTEQCDVWRELAADYELELRDLEKKHEATSVYAH